MKNNLVCLLCVIVLFASCSPAYKTSQTPDDVYYSPAKKIAVEDQYETYASTSDDYYLKMKAKNYDKWNSLDDYNYWNDSRYYANNWYSPYTSPVSFSMSMGYGFGTYPYYAYNPYWYNPWGMGYSPYYTVVYYKNPGVYYKPVRNNANFSSYNNKSYNNYNMPLQNDSRSRTYNNSSMSTNKRQDSYYNTNRSNNYNSNPVRSFNSSGSMSSGGGSRISGGGGRVRP